MDLFEEKSVLVGCCFFQILFKHLLNPSSKMHFVTRPNRKIPIPFIPNGFTAPSAYRNKFAITAISPRMNSLAHSFLYFMLVRTIPNISRREFFFAHHGGTFIEFAVHIDTEITFAMQFTRTDSDLFGDRKILVRQF